MMVFHQGPSPGDPDDSSERLFQIFQFWERFDLSRGGTPGETTLEELEAIKSEVLAALAANPPDITRAESLTAYAALLMAGLTCL